MHLFKDDIVPEIATVDDDVHSESDKDYDPTKEKDIDDGDHAVEEDDPFVRHEQLAHDAPPIDETASTQTATTSKKRKGRGPTKNLKVKEPMYLEYNALGQPCGKWRKEYGKQVGLCVRKISILHAWHEVPEGLKKSFWDDTMVIIYFINLL